ncbi:MAG: hypothetical protein AAF355_08225 [Myxococcota bacterium]
MRALVLRLLMTVLLATPTIALAQYRLAGPPDPPSEANLGDARAAFVEGTELTQAGRWADALAKFEQAYALSAIPAALFNAASALRALGRHRDARDAFTQLLEDPLLDPETRREAELRRNEEAARVATVALQMQLEESEFSLFFDGVRQLPPANGALILEADPGRHAILIEARGYRNWIWEHWLGDGQRVELDVEMEPIPKKKWVRSPLLWSGVAAAVVGGIVTAVLLSRDDDAQYLGTKVTLP